MNKNRIRLTESQLHQVIKESVKRVLNESFGNPTYQDDETQARLKQDTIEMFSSLDNERLMKHFNNRLQIDDPDVLDALWQEVSKRKQMGKL